MLSLGCLQSPEAALEAGFESMQSSHNPLPVVIYKLCLNYPAISDWQIFVFYLWISAPASLKKKIKYALGLFSFCISGRAPIPREGFDMALRLTKGGCRWGPPWIEDDFVSLAGLKAALPQGWKGNSPWVKIQHHKAPSGDDGS